MREAIQRSELRRHAESLVKLANSIGQAEDFPTATAAAFCTLVSKTAEYIAEKLPNAPVGQLLHVHTLLAELGQHLRYPERSRIDQTPWSMVQATEQFLQAHVGSDCKFIIRPQWNYNYSIIGEFVGVYRSLINAQNSWLSVADWELKVGAIAQQRIYCLAFPRVERMNVLLHVNWGHEVGHILASEWIKAHFGTLWQQARPAIEAKIRTHISANATASGLQIAALVANFTKSIKDLAESGLKELISDAIGAHLFGPATLASLVEFSSRFVMDASPLHCNGYPPWRYRLRLAIECIVPDIKDALKMSPPPILKMYGDWCEDWSKETIPTPDQTAIDSDIRTQEAYGLIKTNWQTIKNQVVSLLPQDRQQPYLISKRLDALGELANRISHNIPPNETGTWPTYTAASLADVWNASWAYKIYQFKNVSEPDYSESLETLFLLTLKAIEASFVRSTFASHLP